MPGELQLLLPHPAVLPLVGGIPAPLRTAQRAAAELSPRRIVFWGDSEFCRRWSPQLKMLGTACLGADGESPGQFLDPDGAVLAVSPMGFPSPAALRRFVEQTRPARKPACWNVEGQTVAVYYPAGEQVRPAAALEARCAQAIELEGWWATATEKERRRAERQLCLELPLEGEGFFARLDRRFSIVVSRWLVRTPLTPDMVTTAGLALSLLGCWGLAQGDHGSRMAGALTLWLGFILGGCEGEVGRLKLLHSSALAAYDRTANRLITLATFLAILWQLRRFEPQVRAWIPAATLVFAVSAFVSARRLLRSGRDDPRAGRWSWLTPHGNNRDYTYVLLLFATINRFDWFLWAMALGTGLSIWNLWRLNRA
ncbi:MAG: hypothetical protein HY549_02850 [Elusimicrobia bacterium]|nr:hypothetical protein [Elusimicrobiota bacterium]